MRTIIRTGAARAARPLALGLALFVSGASIAAAQTAPANPPANSGWNTFDPQYDTMNAWNTTWDSGTYDRHHVLVGTVADFKPFRMLLQPANPDDHATMVDLKNGTVIRPEGTSLVPGMRVAIFGYWSKGTFIANRVVLRQPA
jgi:hypothetical protein